MSDASEHSLCASVSVSACILVSATVSSCHGPVRKCVDKWTSVNEAFNSSYSLIVYLYRHCCHQAAVGCNH